MYNFIDSRWIEMIVDITGIILTPGNGGADCPGNGIHFDNNGNRIECCCDECDDLPCCVDIKWSEKCGACSSLNCPKHKKSGDYSI